MVVGARRWGRKAIEDRLGAGVLPPEVEMIPLRRKEAEEEQRRLCIVVGAGFIVVGGWMVIRDYLLRQ